MAEVRVTRTGNNFSAELTEFLNTIVEGDNLGRADKSEIERVEEENQPFAFVIFVRDGTEFSIDNSSGLKGEFIYEILILSWLNSP